MSERPKPPRTMVDTSVLVAVVVAVLVAALVQGLPRHADALPYLSEAHGGSRHLLVAAHALAETYATLTAGTAGIAPHQPCGCEATTRSKCAGLG